MKDKINAAKRAYNDACERLNKVTERIAAYEAPEGEGDGEGGEDEGLTALETEFDTVETDVTRCKADLDRLERIAEARAKHQPLEVVEDSKTPIAVGNEARTYRPDANVSFFRDVIYADKDFEARERLSHHQAEMRDLSTTATAGGGFVPPIYLGEMFAELPRASRPFADILPTRPLPNVGMNMTIPRITTGTSVAVMTSENASVNEVDIVEATITVPVRTIAGQQDVSMQLLERSDPSIDSIIFSDMRAAYDSSLDTQLISGTGASGQTLGIRAVSGVNTVAYTDATPTAAELVPKIYDAIQKVQTVRFQPADTIVMHPRRAAWLASNLSSTFPLFQLGTLTQAAGTQDDGMLRSFSGLRVVLDPNITTAGVGGALTGGTEDEIYVLRAADLALFEGGVQARVLSEVLSGTLTVRIQLYGYAAFASARFPSSITLIQGTGLATPVF